MPRSCLWAIDHHGQVYNLSLDDLSWTKIKPDVAKQSFKKICALENCSWGIGADQKLYMCMFETDKPVRVQVSCYENERWSLNHGWSQKSVSNIKHIYLTKE